jgi:hypothetical protein
MAKSELSVLQREVGDVQRQHPNLSVDNGFVFWFLRAFIVDTESDAGKAVIGASNDRGIDAIHVDHANRQVFIVQGKFRVGRKVSAEAASDVNSFAGLAGVLVAPQRSVAEFFDKADALVRDRVLEVAPLIRRGYQLKLYFVTTGRVSTSLRKGARHLVVAASDSAAWHVFDRPAVLALLQDYLEGAVPPVPQLDLPVDAGENVRGGGIIERYDPQSRIESWVFPMLTNEVGALFRQTKDRLFARNIRGFLDRTGVNKGIGRTLAKRPQDFWYFNNGVTVVCDSAEKTKHHGREVLRVMNPQVINGQQTTRVLADAGSRKASVLVRVIAIPRSRDGGPDNFEALVSRIVEATNYQNAITPSDLRSNDHEQVRIEREFRRIGFQYLRKRESKREVRRRYGTRSRLLVKKEELARAVAACQLDPAIVLRGREALFGDPFYERLFSGRAAKDYLAMAWAGRVVASEARGSRTRRLGRWVALNFVWRSAKGVIDSGLGRERFLETWLHRREEWRLRRLDSYAAFVLKGVAGYYAATRKRDGELLDAVPFFKRVHHDEGFEYFWRRSRNGLRLQAEAALSRFEQDLLGE